MKKICNSTYKIVAFLEIPNFNMDESVDWAIEMITLGYENTSLFELASVDKPTNYFETLNYLKAALNSLNLEIKKDNEAVLSYSSYFIEEIAKGKNIRENLESVYDYCLVRDFENLIFDFYLLKWALSDLDFGNETQSYWPEATKANIEEIIIETATNWVKENRKYYLQKIEI